MADAEPVPLHFLEFRVPGTDLLLHGCATIGAEVLNYRVRKGIGCFHFARSTGYSTLKIL